jgi:hypothetical protein
MEQSIHKRNSNYCFQVSEDLHCGPYDPHLGPKKMRWCLGQSYFSITSSCINLKEVGENQLVRGLVCMRVCETLGGGWRQSDRHNIQLPREILPLFSIIGPHM